MTCALEPARRVRPDPCNLKNDVRLACVMHVLNALDASRAVHLLSGTNFAGSVALDKRARASRPLLSDADRSPVVVLQKVSHSV